MMGGMGGPPSLNLDRPMNRPSGPGASYAAVLRRGGGGRGMEGDLAGLTEGVGGMSLRSKQEAAMALGGMAPPSWGTIEQILDLNNMQQAGGGAGRGYDQHHHHLNPAAGAHQQMGAHQQVGR